jgi:hypothetical protein
VTGSGVQCLLSVLGAVSETLHALAARASVRKAYEGLQSLLSISRIDARTSLASRNRIAKRIKAALRRFLASP